MLFVGSGLGELAIVPVLVTYDDPVLVTYDDPALRDVDTDTVLMLVWCTEPARVETVVSVGCCTATIGQTNSFTIK